MIRTLSYWFRGVRVYIAIASLVLSLETWLWARAAFAGNPMLIRIRAEEVYAWAALCLMALALSIGPTYKLFPKLSGKAIAYDARRLIGVSAAWFASLHVFLAYLSESQGSNATTLTVFRSTSSILGLLALLILIALAVTSFDKAFRTMGIWWLRLHRLIYVAGFVAVLHACMVGAHATSIVPLMLVCGVALALVTLHVCAALRRPGIPRWYWLGVTLAMIALIIVANYGVQQYTQRVSISLGHNH